MDYSHPPGNTAPTALGEAEQNAAHYRLPLSSASTSGFSRARTATERSSSSLRGAVIEHPAENDVLCTRDKTLFKHPGNQVFREMIDSWVGAYSLAGKNKTEKMKITKQIVSCMENQFQSRFLRPVSNSSSTAGGWQEITNSMARDKVSHALRFATKSHKRRSSAAAVSRTVVSSSAASASVSASATLTSTSAASTIRGSSMAKTTHSDNDSVAASDSTMNTEKMNLLFQRQQSILKSLAQRHTETTPPLDSKQKQPTAWWPDDLLEPTAVTPRDDSRGASCEPNKNTPLQGSNDRTEYSCPSEAVHEILDFSSWYMQ